ncbi:hypothetical protein EB118_06575 [bacterium]|nr:hypothetical protein [bacterium]
MTTLAFMTFPTHRVHVAQNSDTGRFIVFKYNRNRIDFDVFDSADPAADYTVTPFSTDRYVIEFSTDSD